MEIRINPVALSDMLGTKAHIAEGLDNAIAAANLMRKMVSIIKRLPKNPEIGEQVSSVIKIPLDYRYATCGDYVIIYTADKDYLTVCRVLYGKRDYIKALFGEVQDEELP